ncbi:MAG: iron-containing alcohol dehydrogenase family protein [Cyanobacteria bacterium J06635_15]
MSVSELSTLMVAPACVIKGHGSLIQAADRIAQMGQRPLMIGGDRTLALAQPFLLDPAWSELTVAPASYGPDCSEATLARLKDAIAAHRADLIIGIGGGKALDTAKLVAHQNRLPVVTIPTSAATCAAWTALSNVYSDQGAFQYDVGLSHCPDLLILDYALIATAPTRTLVAGIGDALAKWYEASISSGHSDKSLIIAAVQQARVLRDILFQKSQAAIAAPGEAAWCEVVDASVLMAGVIGGLGGAQCRTVAAHAIHNGLTHLLESHDTLHGEKVAFGILAQLRLEEMGPNPTLAATARHQLIQFYRQIGLPTTLADLGLNEVTLADLQRATEIACRDGSDIHHLPFPVTPEQVMAAMVSTTAPLAGGARQVSPLSSADSVMQRQENQL